MEKNPRKIPGLTPEGYVHSVHEPSSTPPSTFPNQLTSLENDCRIFLDQLKKQEQEERQDLNNRLDNLLDSSE
jgi:hypothetical protein